ncbi:hypothetical protein ACJW30_04G138800 [Castanea mollissima]
MYCVYMLGNIWSCNCNKRKFSMNHHTNRFSHVQVHSSCPIRQCPIKVVQKLCQNKLNCGYGKGYSWATPPTSSKWDKLEIISFKVYRRSQEPFWMKFLWIVP